MNSILKFVLQLIVFSLLVFGLHYAGQLVFEVQEKWDTAHYNLFQIYFVQAIFSLAVIFMITGIAKVFFNYIGFVFLGAMLLRAVVSYIFIRPVLELGESENFVKYNFLIAFMVYLAFDVYVTYLVLNQKDITEWNTSKKVS